MARSLRPVVAALVLAGASLPGIAHAEPTDPVVIGWWSYFDNTKIDTTTSPAHQVTKFGDPNTYYYEQSGGKGLQEDPNVLPKDQAWQNTVSFILSKSNGATLSPDFSIDTTSDLNQFTQAYFGWALVLLYVPKDKYCDDYKIHIGSVDDGVQAMANATILGYANLGDQNKYIDMVEYGSNPPKLVLRPGINEVVLIHEDQAAVQRYVHNVWIEHNGVQVPLAPKNIAWGRVLDGVTTKPIYESTVGITGAVNDTFLTGPFGFYFFAGLADGAYGLTADKGGYKTGAANVTVAMGAAMTEVVRTDLPLALGCSCPNGKMCGPNGGCLDPCVAKGEVGETCADPAATCVNHLCVKDPCDTLKCAVGFTCQSVPKGMPPVKVATCVELACSNVCCGAGQVCSAGACVTDNCGAGCPAGKTCAAGACVDSCSVITCVDNLVCKGGVCVTACAADPSGCQPDGGLNVGGGGASSSSSSGGLGGASSTTSSGAGGAAPGASPDSSGGCGCELAGKRGTGGVAALLGAAVGLLARRRRRSRARAAKA